MAFKLNEPARKLGALTSNLAYKLALRMDLEYKAEKIAQSKPNGSVDFGDVQEGLLQCLPRNYYDVDEELPEWIKSRVSEELHYYKDPKTGTVQGCIPIIENFNKKIAIPSSEFHNALEPFSEYIRDVVRQILQNPKALEGLDLCKEEALALSNIFTVLSDEACMGVTIYTRTIEDGTLVGFGEPLSKGVFKHVSNLFKDLAAKLPSIDGEKKILKSVS